MNKKILLLCCFWHVIQFTAAQTENQPQDSLPFYEHYSFKELDKAADIYYNKGDYEESLKLNIELLKKGLKNQNNYHIHQGYRNLGYDYLGLNDTLQAKESFEKSERYAKLAKNDTATALSYMDLANVYAELEQNYEKAFQYHDKSIALFEKLKDSAGIADAHYNTVLTAMDANELNKAYVHLLKARKFNDFNKEHFNYIGIDVLTGEYHLEKGNYELADSYFNKAIEEAKKKNLSLELESAYLGLSKSLFAQEKYKEAYKMRAEFDKYLEQNMRNVNNAQTETVSAKFQVSEYRKDIEAAELKNQLQAEIVKNKSNLNTILYVISGILLLLFIIFLLAFRRRKQLVRKLRRRNREFLEAKQHAEKMSRSKTEFFSTVSHELRTPLYGVIGLSSILLEDPSLKNHEEDLKSLKFSADYLLALINNVLQINKIDANKMEAHITNFNIDNLLDKIASSFEYMRLQNKNKLSVHISDKVPKVLRGNAIALSQILMNLVGNACKFTENGQITISVNPVKVSATNAVLCFKVTDTGIGISEKDQERIFNAFSQVDNENYSYQGTGLGLTIVKKLLKRSNSEINVESKKKGGSSFWFDLSFEVVDKAENKPEDNLLNKKLLVDKRILIVEDNRINQAVTKKILTKNQVLCTIAENGKEAVEQVKQNNFDLVLMDINMPVMDGLEATKKIRSFNTTIPIIALTAVEVEDMRFEIYNSGMNDIIVKPYDMNKFLQVILRNLTVFYSGKMAPQFF
ncbi:tetratricopeptide repeat-containing hybrid sensor histidine kinase/response regulator [Marixanthomonas spongiae]|uniref:histidine kinase n=1 Tax=Marixanthomonas spongiae TaxID=2174845 RepID=A0A2U0HZ68_9FLAO|nr:response regulator [Marixanthomonas spongiae]PVW14137.1 hybrid sensor histidine kinase/response regulator [Marixanthomonas spongiae]